MNNTTPMKPCPFCGNPPYVSKISGCIGCHGDNCRIAGDAMRPEEWNRRPIEDALQARIQKLEATLNTICRDCEIKEVFGDECEKCPVRNILNP